MSQKPLLPWLQQCFNLISWHLVIIIIGNAEDQSWQISSADRRELGSGKTNVYPRPACLFWGCFFSPHAAVVQLSIYALSSTYSTSSSPLLYHYLTSFSTCCFLPLALFWFATCWQADVDSSQLNGFLGSCLLEITVSFKALIKMALTLWKRLVCSPKEQPGFYMSLITTVSKCQLLTFDSDVKYVTK